MINKSKKQKLNPIDVLIVLLLMLIIVSSVYFFSERNSILMQSVYDIEYEIVIDSIPEDLANNMSAGDLIYDSTTLCQIGTVTGAKVEYLKSGATQLTLEIKAKANKYGEQISIEGVPLEERNYIDFRSINLAYNGIVENIFIISDQGA